MNMIKSFRKGFLPFGLLICTCFMMGCSKEKPAQQPNIIFAIADDWGWPHASVYGDPVVQTPAFDRVSKRCTS